MTKQKHKNISLYFAYILFLLLTAVFLLISFNVVKEVPRLSECSRSRLSEGITFSTYEKLPNISYSKELAVCSELETQTVSDIGEVKPVLINENYFDIYNIYVSGSKITKEHITNKAPAIVISDKAALSLNLDKNVVGKTISLWDKEFTIVGVYKKPSGFLREISSDIYDRVYVPYTCYKDYSKLSIDVLTAPKSSYSEKGLPLMGITQTDKEFYIKNDLAVKHDIIANFPILLISVINLIFVIFAIKIISSMFRKSYHKLHKEYKHEYFFILLRQNFSYLLPRFLLSIILITLPITLFILFTPKLIMPVNYIPYDNIFELKHYILAFTNEMQLNNANLTVANNYHQNLSFNSIVILSILLIVLIILLIVISKHLIKKIGKKN